MSDTTPDRPDTEDDCRPQVALPSGGVPVWAIGVAAGAIGLAMLLTLNAHRGQLAVAMPVEDAPRLVPTLPRALAGASAALLERPDPVDRGPSFARVEDDRPPFSEPLNWQGTPAPFAAPAYAPPPPAARQGRSFEGPRGTVIFRTEPMPGAPIPGGGFTGGARPAVAGGSAVVYDGGAPGSADDKPLGEGAARATIIRNRAAVVAQGELLAATLETPVNSQRPGPIRAVVSRDVRGFDGGRVLIPRGSRLIGEYRADPAAGKRRILATWTRFGRLSARGAN